MSMTNDNVSPRDVGQGVSAIELTQEELQLVQRCLSQRVGYHYRKRQELHREFTQEQSSEVKVLRQVLLKIRFA